MDKDSIDFYYKEVDTLTIELGIELIPLVDVEKGGELLEQIMGVRQQIAMDLEVEIPKVHIIDNVDIEPFEYCIKLKGIEVGRCFIPKWHYLCIDLGTVTRKIRGKKTKDPAFGISAIWIDQTKTDKAKSAGYTVACPPGIIVTYLSRIIKRNIADILGLQDTQNILNRLCNKYPTVVKEATREDRGLGIVEICKILQGLLRENVSIRNMVSILESVAANGYISKDIRFHIEKARQVLSKQICPQYDDEAKKKDQIDDKSLNIPAIYHYYGKDEKKIQTKKLINGL